METILLHTLNSEYSSLGTNLKGLIAKRFKVDSHEMLIKRLEARTSSYYTASAVSSPFRRE